MHHTVNALTALGTVAAAAPTWMASYGAPSGKPSLPSPTVDRIISLNVFANYVVLFLFFFYLKLNSPTNLIRPELRSSGSSACTFFTDIWTNELMCSMPTTLPLRPVYKQWDKRQISFSCHHLCAVKRVKGLHGITIFAKQAVRYPLPEPTSSADAPSASLSLSSSKAWACC